MNDTYCEHPDVNQLKQQHIAATVIAAAAETYWGI
jgi:hypothetical protein